MILMVEMSALTIVNLKVEFFSLLFWIVNFFKT